MIETENMVNAKLGFAEQTFSFGGAKVLTTIGYERSTLDDFIATLVLTGVETLVDVRDRAQSRMRGFSKTALAEAVRAAGLDYLHMPTLGDPKAGRDAARAGNFEQFREIYRTVLLSKEAQLAISDLKNLAVQSRICLMCFERDQRNCHRKMVSDLLEDDLGVKTTHLGVQKGASRRAA